MEISEKEIETFNEIKTFGFKGKDTIRGGTMRSVFLMPTLRTYKWFGNKFIADRGECVTPIFYSCSTLAGYVTGGPRYRVMCICQY